MANEACVAHLKKNKAGFEAWRKAHIGPNDRIDLKCADLAGCDFSGLNLSSADFTSANLAGANLRLANLSKATLLQTNLSKADLTEAICVEANLQNCDLRDTTLKLVNLSRARITLKENEPVTFDRCILTGAEMNYQQFNNCVFANCHLESAGCQAARFIGAWLDGSKFNGAILQRALFNDASCKDVDFTRASLIEAHLSGADIAGANFLEANLTRTNLRDITNASAALNLEKTIFPDDPESHPQWFETAKLPRYEKNCHWEFVRKIGRMQLFGVSYFLMIYLVTTFYVVGQYNDKIDAVKAWAELKETEGNIAVRPVAKKLRDLEPFQIGSSSVLLLISTVLLVAASIVYAFGCPDEIKDFSKTEWQYAHKRSLVHYWPLSWSRPKTRGLCLFLYGLGGSIFLPVTIYKLYVASYYAWEFSTWF